MIKFDNETMQYIAMFEKMTKASVKDCIIEKDAITIIVKEGDIGLAIGKNGIIVNKIKKKFGKEIHIYEHSDDIKKFVANLLYPIKIERVEVEGGKLRLYIAPSDKRRAIGRGGKKINKTRELLRRHFKAEEIKVI